MPSKKDDRAKRRTEIMRTISEAMKALSAKKQMDWTRDTSATAAAQDDLDKAMMGFIEGTATRDEVKRAYKRYADLHVA